MLTKRYLWTCPNKKVRGWGLRNEPYFKMRLCYICNQEFEDLGDYIIHINGHDCHDDRYIHHCSHCQGRFKYLQAESTLKQQQTNNGTSAESNQSGLQQLETQRSGAPSAPTHTPTKKEWTNTGIRSIEPSRKHLTSWVYETTKKE